MKKLLFVLTLALLPVQAWAQGTVTRSLASTSCAIDGCLALGVEGYGSAAVQLIVTGTATAVVEGSVNGTDFRTLQISASDGSGNVTSATATGMWYVNVGGITQVRVRLSICTSCTVIAHIQGSRSGGGASGGGGGGGGDATAANQSTEITALQSLAHIELPESGTHVSGESGVLALAVRNDAGTVLASNGQRIPLSMDANGALRVTGGTAGTQYTQDAALTVASTVGAMPMGRASAAAPTNVSADDDAVMAWYTRAGAQAVQPTFAGTIALADAGVVGPGVQRVTIASDGNGRLATVAAVTSITNVVHVDDNSGSLTVDNGGTFAVQAAQSGTWTVTGATGASSITMQGAAATDAAVAGNPVYVGGRASAAAPSAVSTDGDAVPFWLFKTGNQAVTIVNSDGTIPAIGTDATHGSTVSATGNQQVSEAADFTGSALPNAVTAGQADRAKSTLSGVQYVMAVNKDGSTVGHVIVDSGGGGGTQYAEDAAHVSGDTGTLALVRRQDTTSSSSGTDGDYSTLNTDASGRLWVNCGTGCSGGTQYTQDNALTVGTTVGNAVMGRASAAAPTDVSADNDAVLAWYLKSGATVTQPSFGGVLATAGNGVSGTGVQRVTIASDSTGTVALAAGAATIGALTANQSVNLAQVGGTTVVTGGTAGTQGIAGIQAHDAPVSGNNPLLAGAYAGNSVPSEVSADGDLVRLWALRSGALANQPTFGGVLAIAGNGATTTGTQRVTLANDSTGVLASVGTVTTVTGVTTVSTVTNLSQLGGSAVPVEDAAETAGGTGIYAMAVRRDTAASSSGTTGDNSTINVDALGKLWVTGSYAEDSAHASGDTGLFVLTKRTDAVAASAGTDGDYQTLNTDASGRLWVNCSTGCSGGTQYVEDVASAGGETLTLAGAVRQNTLSSSVSADGDYGYLKLDTNGSLYVNPFGATQAAATYLTVRLSDGTNFLNASSDQTEDAASAGGETGPMVLTVRRDSAASSAGTDGDFATLNTDGLGRLWVNCGTGCSGGTQYTQDAALTVATSVVTMSGGRASAAVPTDVSADNDAVMAWYLRSGALATQPTYGGVLSVAGNGVSGTGVQRVTLASDSTGQVALAAGSNTIGALTANQSVNVAQINGVTTLMGNGASGTGAQRVTIANDSTGVLATVSTVTSLSQLGGVALPIEDAAETAGGVGIYAMGVRRDTLASSANTTGDNTMASYTSNGAMWTAPAASISGGATTLKYTSVGSTEDEHQVKATAGTLYSITATNTNAAARYLRCSNATAASNTPGTTTPILDLAIPGSTAGAGITFSFPVGVSFSTALTCWTVTGAADTDVAEVAANEIKLLYSFF